jgi:hypothetical protein
MMYVIKRQPHDNPSVWLARLMPETWGEHDQAMRFETRRQAQRTAAAVKVSGDWSIESAAPCPISKYKLRQCYRRRPPCEKGLRGV